MSDELLMALMEERVKAALEVHVGQVLTADDLKVVEQPIKDAMAAYRAEVPATVGAAAAPSSAYESALGAFIIRHNPYGILEKLDLPELPGEATIETPWVRFSGVLRDRFASNALPEGEPIPAGQVVNFSYEDWPHLAETPDPVPPKLADLQPRPTLPAQSVSFYSHNVVKIVRLRYTVKDRLYPDGSQLAQTHGPDRATSYILIMYSGNDN